MFTWKTKSPVLDRTDDHSPVVILESGAGSGQRSFIGIINPEICVPPGEAGLSFMRDFLRKNRRAKKSGDPPFTEGFVGFVSYDLGAKWMGIKKRNNELGIRNYRATPEAYFVYVDKVIPLMGGFLGAAYIDVPVHQYPTLSLNVSHITKHEYFEKVAKIKEYLYAGETYQVNFSQRFEIPYAKNALELYQKVTNINPSPFQFFLETPDFAIISNSPERLFRIRHTTHGRSIETRPIKGTVPRGYTQEEDKKNIEKLLASPKEEAELAMIVDLERNDLGKICKPGTIAVNENRVIEKYSHVIHTVSNIRGILRENCDWYDALRALFPGGSVTGCPKKRTMEIISELEGTPRGIYCGSAGYIDISGECDFNIMIRTMWLDKSKIPALLSFRSGGGIVVDSEPEKEYEESFHKAQAIFQSI